jgi:phosphatidylglycerol:prolipoprotein diacylglycerol transferase
MIPYIHVPDLKIGPLTLHPFGLLVATGVILGTWLATKRARERGLDLDKLNSFITWMLVAGFMGGHMLDEIFYHPAELVKRPYSIFFLWEGLSSFGGFTGALIGIVLWKYFDSTPVWRTPLFTISKFHRRPVTMPILPFADLILSVFPVAWVFGRSGCSVVHDHPGMRADPGALLAVAYGRWDPSTVMHLPLGIELRHGNAPQYDLGTLELMFTIVLASLLAITWRRKLATGSYVAATALAYAPVRLAMDFMRIHDGEAADPRYGGFTPAQWACVALFAFGLVMVARVRQIAASGKDPLDLVTEPRHLPPAPAPPPPPEEDPVAG